VRKTEQSSGGKEGKGVDVMPYLPYLAAVAAEKVGRKVSRKVNISSHSNSSLGVHGGVDDGKVFVAVVMPNCGKIKGETTSFPLSA